MNASTRNFISVLVLSAAPLLAWSQQKDPHQGMGMGQMKCTDKSGTKCLDMTDQGTKQSASSVAASLTSGEVKAVDKKNNAVTLKHGRIQSKTVQMGPMTMTFPVQTSSMLDTVKTGDKVKFNVENVNGAATVTVLEPQKK